MSGTDAPDGWSHPRRIGIAGAGLAGLALALRLRRAGYHSLVLERRGRAALAGEGAFLTLAPNAINALRPLGVAEAVIGAGVNTRGLEFLDERGRSLAFADQSDHLRAFGAPSVTIARGRLLEILADAAERAGVEVRYGWHVRSVQDGDGVVTIESDTGDRVGVAWLAACDGLRSGTRRLVFPDFPTPRFTGLIGTGAVTEAADVPATHGVMRLVFGHAGSFGYLRARDGDPVYWFNSYPADRPDAGRDGPSYVEWLRALHRDDPPFVDRILSRVPRIGRDYPIYELPALPAWHRGRVVLAGDAAHAVGPHAGQGAAMAFEDAAVLAACVAASPGTVEAFARYEAVRRPRVTRVAALTARNAAQKRAITWLDRLLRRLILPLALPSAMRAGRALLAYRAEDETVSRIAAAREA